MAGGSASGSDRRRRLNPRMVARIGRWEVETAAGTVDRRVVIGTLVGVLVLVGGFFVGAAGGVGGIGVDDGLYRVGVDDDHQLYPAIVDDATFTTRDPSRDALRNGNVELLVEGSTIRGTDTPKSRAAAAELRSTLRAYNDRILNDEPNQTAAFPVAVRVSYESRTDVDRGSGGGDGGGDGDGSGDGDGGGSGDGSGDGDGDGDGDGGGSGGGDGDGSGGGDGDGSGGGDGGGGGPIGVPNVGSGPLFTGQSSGTPSDISPPFPFESLLLAFLFVVPMNFVIQAYGGSILDERLDRRGEPLLVAPVSPIDIVAGKTLPYLLGILAVAAVTALAIGGGPVSIAAVAPLGLLFLGATFVGAMFARSYKELTFVTVAVSTGLTAYAFVPAIFSSIGPIGLISPLTLVVRDLQGVAVSPVEFAFPTVPLTLTGAILFGLGTSVYREEDMFTQRALTDKALDALARHVRRSRVGGPASVAAITALAIPFVFVAELLVVALLFALPVAVSVPIVIGAIVVIEEAAKSLHVYAGFSHDRLRRTDAVAAAVGVASGLGFFVAEKATLAVQLVGLGDVAQGRAAFGTTQAVRSALDIGLPDPVVALVLLLLPLVLHITTATLSALGARRGKWAYGIGIAAAIVVHAAYNLSILVIAGVV